MKKQPTEEGLHQIKPLIHEPKAMAKQRLMDFADSLPLSRSDNYGAIPGTEVTYSQMMVQAAEYLHSGRYWSEGGRFESQSLYPTFWEDYEVVTETKVDPNDKFSFFSCSC